MEKKLALVSYLKSKTFIVAELIPNNKSLIFINIFIKRKRKEKWN
jgi:hypothetical protein